MILSSFLTELVLEDLWSLVWKMGPIFLWILVLYLRKFMYLVLKLHDSCRNFSPYGSYVLATPLLPYLRTGYTSTFQMALRDLPRLTMLTYHANLQKRTASVTSQFRPDITHQAEQ